MWWLPYLEQKLFTDLACNLCLLIAQPQAYVAYGIQDTCDLPPGVVLGLFS